MSPMEIKDIEKRVIEVFVDKSSMDVGQIGFESSLIDDLGMDSLDAVEMVFEFEEQYGIDIPDEQIREFKKVKDIVRYLVERLVTDRSGF